MQIEVKAPRDFLPAGFRRGRARRDFGDWRGEFELLLSSGLDGVFADHPDLVVELLGRPAGSDGGRA